ncbi:hypothetical protein [Ornithinicoccus halotolerans]|uniref:hypothetical protein n=1 Tax=Ornithinicoccus halotolerans TaxID=1748220 RepID=UPI001296475A|nr:hypothetical protein [Ornithinicoccus halotolerans]
MQQAQRPESRDALVTPRDFRENAAANAVAEHLTAVLGSAVKPRKWDDGSAPAMHDFYIEGGIHKIALEVTTLADGERVGRDIRWEREAPEGRVKVAGLSGCWVALHDGDAEAGDVIATIRAQLPRLQALGLTRLDTRAWQEHALAPSILRPAWYEASRALNLMGVIEVSSVTDASQALLDEYGGEVHVARGFGTTRPIDRNFPVGVIHEQLRDPRHHASDVEKLLAVSDATAKHLWMWVELTEGFAIIRSLEESLPDVDVDAEGIDGVWLGRSPTPSILAGYVWLRGAGWGAFSTARNGVVDA